MKKLISFILAAALVLSLGFAALASDETADGASPAVELTDVQPGSWYYDQVNDMVASGVITGYEDGSFKPDQTVNVVEAITMIARMTGAPSGELDGFWGGAQLDHAYRSGWISESDAARGEYSKSVSRELACKMIAAAYGMGYPAGTVLPFTDAGSVGASYVGSVLALYANGLLAGFTDGTLRPQGALTRAEIATLLYRAEHRDELAEPIEPEPIEDFITAEGYTADEILAHFAATALEAEYGVTDKPVTRWVEPVSYFIDSDGASNSDLEYLRRLMDAINEIPGFPGYVPAASEDEAALCIYFVSAEEINRIGGSDGSYQFNGYVTINWSEGGGITDSSVYINCELAMEARPAVIAEELCQGLGLLQDVYDQPESIFYQYHYQHYFTANWPSPLDWAVMRLLYSDVLRPGMNESEALAAAATIVR